MKTENNSIGQVGKQLDSTPKFTKGGWNRNIAPACKYPVIFAGRNTHVAQVITRGIPESEQEANANLIASAPDLLAALQPFTLLNPLHCPEYAGQIELAKKAIAKALNS